MVVVGCSSVIEGAPTANSGDVPAYRASVSSSLEASAASSSARESQRQASSTTQAIHTVCDDLASSSVDAITAVNAYVDATNNSVSDIGATAGPAADALNHSADTVAAGIVDALPPELRDALNAYVDAARGVATAVAENHGVSQFNSAIDRLNSTKDDAIQRCDALYR